jgi:hypothetical protein
LIRTKKFLQLNSLCNHPEPARDKHFGEIKKRIATVVLVHVFGKPCQYWFSEYGAEIQAGQGFGKTADWFSVK